MSLDPGPSHLEQARRRVARLERDLDGALSLLAAAAMAQPNGELLVPFDRLTEVAGLEPALEQYRDEHRRAIVVRARP